MKKIYLVSIALVMAGCASQENKMAEYLIKNPKLVFDVIEEHPEQFIEVVNRAAKKAQELQYSKQSSALRDQQNEQLKNPLKPDLAESKLLYGSKKSPIVIVEYADFQCPACKMAHDSLKQIKHKYKNQVQFYFKNMPLDFHKLAMPAAKYFEAAKLIDRIKAEKFFDLVFESQSQMRSEEFLKETLKRAGFNVAELLTKMNRSAVESAINSDIEEFQKFGFTGTPVVLVNGVALHGAQPIEEIERIIKLTAARSE